MFLEQQIRMISKGSGDTEPRVMIRKLSHEKCTFCNKIENGYFKQK